MMEQGRRPEMGAAVSLRRLRQLDVDGAPGGQPASQGARAFAGARRGLASPQGCLASTRRLLALHSPWGTEGPACPRREYGR